MATAGAQTPVHTPVHTPAQTPVRTPIHTSVPLLVPVQATPVMSTRAALTPAFPHALQGLLAGAVLQAPVVSSPVPSAPSSVRLAPAQGVFVAHLPAKPHPAPLPPAVTLPVASLGTLPAGAASPRPMLMPQLPNFMRQASVGHLTPMNSIHIAGAATPQPIPSSSQGSDSGRCATPRMGKGRFSQSTPLLKLDVQKGDKVWGSGQSDAGASTCVSSSVKLSNSPVGTGLSSTPIDTGRSLSPMGTEPEGVSSRRRSMSADDLDVPCLTRGRDSIAYERQQFLRGVDKERRWLRRALSTEVRHVMEMERQNRYHAEEEECLTARRRHQDQRNRDASVRRQRLDMKRHEEEQRRSADERRLARHEYSRQRNELRMQREEEARLQKVYYAKLCRDAEKRHLSEVELAVQRENGLQAVDERCKELQALDSARSGTLDSHRMAFQHAAREAREAQELRARRASELSSQRQEEVHARVLDKQRRERIKDEKLARQRSEWQQQFAEITAERSARRSFVHEGATRLIEERRKSVTMQVIDKDSRYEALDLERQRLRKLRRQVQVEARRAMEVVKQEIERQAITSKYSPEKVHRQVESLLQTSVLPPQLQMDALRVAEQAAQASSPRHSLSSPFGRHHCSTGNAAASPRSLI